MNVNQAPDWLTDLLQAHCSSEELDQVKNYLHAETWASPSALQRNWLEHQDDIPLRFHLEIDMEV